MKSAPVETTAADLRRLLGIPRNNLSDLAKRGVVVKGEKRGSYLLQPSVTRYCQHLRAHVAGRDVEKYVKTRTRVGQVQLQNETIPGVKVEGRGTTKLWNFNRMLGMSIATFEHFKST